MEVFHPAMSREGEVASSTARSSTFEYRATPSSIPDTSITSQHA